MLVDKRDLARFGRVVAGLGFVPVPSWGYGPHHFYIAQDEALGESLKLDVVTSLRYGGRSGVLGCRALAGSLARRRRESGISVPEYLDGFLGLLLHCVLDKKAFREDHRQELERLVSLLDSDGTKTREAEGRFLSALGSSLTLTEATAAVRRGDWDSLLRRRRRMVWELGHREPVTSVARWAGGKLARLFGPSVNAASRVGRPIHPRK